MGDRRARSLRVLATISAGLALSMALSGCATQPDPFETREAISQAAEEPATGDELDPFDATLHPEPQVEPGGCEPYLVITVRGTGEPESGQLLSPVARAIADARAGQVRVDDLPYPAETDVQRGATEGVRLLIDTLRVHAAACPGQRFVVLGYSQGALIVGDALSEPEDRVVGLRAGALSDEVAARVLAVVLYGDPRFTGAAGYNVGTFDPARDGVFPRPDGSLDPFASRLRNYCVADDIVCQTSFELSEEGHVAYFTNGMQQDGAAFVIAQFPARSEATETRTDGTNPGGSASTD